MIALRYIGYVVFFGIIVGMGMILFSIRSATHIPAQWHVDPLTAPNIATPNKYRIAPADLTERRIDEEAGVYLANPALMAEELDKYVMQQPRTLRLAGTPEAGWVTYVQRTKYMRAPDYITVLFIDLGEGRSTLAMFSRSRYGYGDMGVNEARVKDWLSVLEGFAEPQQ